MQQQLQIMTIKNSYTDCLSEINNAQINNAIGIDVVMIRYNLIEHNVFIRKYQKFYGNTIEINQI